ncbi:MAG: flagellar hook-length control protein FliK [Defluviitaleaceae bacterium]|nr:flagellar hook-length control protein FliK [Defluviitaleaceae bacterium]
MKINDMVNGVFTGAGAGKKEKSVQGEGFEVMLAKAEKRQQQAQPQAVPEPQNKTENRTENRERRQETQKKESPRNDEATSTSAATQGQEQPQAEAPEAEIAEQIVEQVAAIMEVPIEVVQEWLLELDLTAVELTDPAVVSQVLQHAMEVESPLEVINDPIFAEKFVEVNEAVAEIVNEAEKMQGATVKLSNEARTVVDKLQTTVTNGEIVVEHTEEALLGDDKPAEKQDTFLAYDEPVTESPQVTNLQTSPTIEQPVTTAAAQPQPVNTADVIEQITNQIKLTNAGENFTEIKMTLKPATLGDIILRVVTQNGIVMAQFEAENQRVKEALESSFNQLRDSLHGAGIQFSELSVSVRQDNNERMSQFQRARQQSRVRAESIADVSEIEEEISHHDGMIDVTA